MATPILVFVTLGIFNFISSIVQGVAGIGDAIFMQVLWLLACGFSEEFSSTPLGTEPIRVVALIMYIRLLVMSPLVVYLGLNDGIFSRSMTIMMAVPSTILSIIGVPLFNKMSGGDLKMVLGITSFIFAIAYVCIIIYRKWRRTRQLQELRSRNVKLVVEADALDEEAQQSLNTSIVNLHSAFVLNAPNNSIFAMRPPPLTGSVGSQASFLCSFRSLPLIQQSAPPSKSNQNVEFPPSTTVIAENVQEHVIDARTGLPAGTTEAFLSTIGGDVFIASETKEPHVNEENVPPLTPSKISPSRTMAYTRVRINRNIDANGKIKRSIKIGAAVAASIAGIMASLTGVNAPPQIIFILLYDAPNYLVHVNFTAQSIPSNVIRFFMAAVNGSFKWDMAPLLLDVIVFGSAGVFVGNKIGRLLGPRSFNIFVLCLLLLCSLAMMGNHQTLLIFATFSTIVITVVCGYMENKTNKPIIEKQRLAELEVEKRLYNCIEELQRNNSLGERAVTSPPVSLERMQRATRPKPLWGGANFDNDDEGNNGSAADKEARHGISPAAEREDRGLAHGERDGEEDNTKLRAVVSHTHTVEEPDERTIPAVLDGGGGQNGITSVHSSNPSSSSHGRAPYRPATTSPSVGISAEQQQQQQLSHFERQSPSLRSLDSSVQIMSSSDDDGVKRR